MNKKICFIILFIVLLLSSCKTIKFDNYSNEENMNLTDFNSFVIDGANTSFKNYKFIDLRNNDDYVLMHISLFHKNIYYNENEFNSLLIKYIENDNHAKKQVPIILISSKNDFYSNKAYEYLVSEGYLNVKNVFIGVEGLEESLSSDSPYTVLYNDCGCE